MATVYDGSIAYHQEEMAKYKAEADKAFREMMALANKAGLDSSEVIRIWVDATYAKQWGGWHQHGLRDAQDLAGWSFRDCLTCDRTTDHNDENVCQQCHTPVPEEVYA